MPTYPTIGGAAGFLGRDVPPEAIYCTCGIRFEGDSQDAVLAAQRDHAAQMRNPDEHTEVPF